MSFLSSFSASFSSKAGAVLAAVPHKQKVFEAIRGRVNLPWRAYHHLDFEGDFVAQVGHTSIKLRHYGRSTGASVENDIFWSGINGEWEPWSLRLWMTLAVRSQTVLDIGANTGVYALVAQALQPSARVLAFEPVQRVFTQLEANAALNGFAIECAKIALSDYDGEGTFFEPVGHHPYTVTVNQAGPPPGLETIKRVVAVRKLDSFLAEHAVGKVDLIKLDVETHEPEVLAGYREGLRRDRPTVLIEILDDATGARVEALLDGLDYELYAIDERQGPKPAHHLRRHSGLNYLVCSKAIARTLRL